MDPGLFGESSADGLGGKKESKKRR